MPTRNILPFCICLLFVFAGQVPVAFALLGKLGSSSSYVIGGMMLSIVTGVIAIGIFLSQAQTLGKEWLDKADLALKAAGGLLAIVITFWFGLLQHEQEQKAKDAADTKAALELQNQSILAKKLEKDRLRAAENAIRFREFLSHISSTDAYLRLQAVTNIGELISEHDAYDLTASQSLFTAAHHDADEKIRKAALIFLPEGIEQIAETTNFTSAVIELTKKKSSADWSQEYKLYLALVSIKDSASNPATQKTAGDLITQLSAGKIEDASKLAASITTELPNSKAAADNTAKLDQLAPAIIYSLTASGNVPTLFPNNTAAETTQKIQEAIQNTSPDAVASAIKNLPREVAQQLSARVYLQIANEAQRAQAKQAQSALGSKGYICPGIQNVKGRGYIPDTLEVRYFVIESKDEAEKILDVLKEKGARDGRVSYVIPTASDLRISPDIKSHFEVWAGKSSF